MLCDSNILFYAADPADTVCLPFVERDDAAIASVSRIEVLGFPGWRNLSADRRSRLHEIVSSMWEHGLNEAVIQRSIALRQETKLTLGDAIVAATALTHDVPLVTRNVQDFRHIVGLKIINPFDPT
jgi:toxin FitB